MSATVLIHCSIFSHEAPICLLHITMTANILKEWVWVNALLFLLKWESSTGNMYEATSKDMDILWLVSSVIGSYYELVQ